MKIRCPNCHFGIQFEEQPASKSDETKGPLVCPSCNSRIDFAVDATVPIFPGSGEKLDHFEIREELGSGAFGVVYAAYDTELERMVAIKAARLGFAGVRALRSMYKEARAASTISHPNVIQVYEIGVYNDLPYLVTEYIDGITLGEWLKVKEHSFQELAAICRTICEAVYAAHCERVVHRDLKPGNILVDRHDQPHVGDFGLARRETASDATIAATGAVLGTIAYMSPEQASGQPDKVDERSDIYALGVVLYHMLTGKKPFAASESRTLLYKIQHEEPQPPRKVNKNIPLDLETICMRAMRKEPANRYQTAQEMAEDLGLYLEQKPIRARPVSKLERVTRWVRKNRSFAATIAATMLLGTATALLAVTRSGEAGTVPVTMECRLPGDVAADSVSVDWSFARLDDRRLVDPQQVVHVRKTGTRVAVDLAPDEYLVVVNVPGVGFHEVLRLVPQDETAMPGNYNPTAFEFQDGVVQLPPVDIQRESNVVDSMAFIRGGPYTAGQAGNVFSPQTNFQVKDFFLQTTEVSHDAFTDRVTEPVVYIGEDPPPGGLYPVVGVHFYAAAHYAEIVGCRLMTEIEYEYAATNGGQTANPWNSDWLPEPRWQLNPVGQPAEDSTLESQVLGLFSNASEMTSTLLAPLGDGKMPGTSLQVVQDSYVYKGGPYKRADAESGAPVNLTDRRSLQSRYQSGDFLSFRCARSAEPLDFKSLEAVQNRYR